MSLLQEKLREVAMSMMPIVLIVLIVNWTFVPLETHVFQAFLLGAFLVLIGLSIFLFGADLGIGEMGDHMGSSLARRNHFILVLVVGAILGFLITVAEPDLQILGAQIQNASANAISSWSIVLVVSAGVAVMLAIGLARSIIKWPLKYVFAIFYGIILILSFFVPPAFLAMSFDASGATTGALTVPFILAFGKGLASSIQTHSSDEDVFGFVGISSIGPIIAVMLLSILSGQSELSASSVSAAPAMALGERLLTNLTHIAVETLIAIVPLIVSFILFQLLIRKTSKRQNRRIMRGFVYTFIGLWLFLTGVNVGFMEVGLIIGSGLAELNSLPILVGVSLILGLVVILAEPAVHVLADQVEDVTSGAIRRSYILVSLSLGVGTAVALSALRIWIPWLELWHILLPGFGTAIIMSFFSRQSFVGLAFDSGGVASGPMAATFILAYAQGAASSIPTADVLADGFGVIALIAMTPIIAIQIMGLIYDRKTRKEGIDHADE